jgi:DNA (cytosine-5)-methyltransferase 1
MVLDDKDTRKAVYCLAGNSIDRADTAGCNGKGWTEDVSFTLNTIDRPAVYDPSVHHGYHEFDDVSETVRSRYGTGGNNQPLVVAGTDPVSNGNGQLNQISMSDKANALDTMHDQQCVMTFEAFGVYAERQTGSSLKARNDGVSNCDVVCENTNNSVRRLTPMECERLQGYPDRWTDIPGASDSKRYKALGNSIALPFWEHLAHRFVEIGNVKSIGSLFDGIGGFPLVFQRASAETKWTSEIEPFCEEVVKIRFGAQQ